MDDELVYRAELADQFLARLQTLSPAQWHELVAHHRGDEGFYALALELADEATRLLGPERRDAYEAVLTERLAQLRRLVEHAVLPPPVAGDAERMTRGAVRALLVRDAFGFNAGAFAELVRPFRTYLDLTDVERSAARVRTPPSGGAPIERNASDAR